MGKICNNCGVTLEEGASSCPGCETKVPDNADRLENTAIKQEKIETSSEGASTNQAPADTLPPAPGKIGPLLGTYLRQSLDILKNPRQMLPTIILGLVWLAIALLGSLGINPLPVRILSFLTYAQGGMFGGLIGAVGGIVGKVIVAAFLNATLLPLLQKKRPFSEIGGGFKKFAGMLAVKSIGSAASLLGGTGASLLLYTFMNSNHSLENSMVGIIAFVIMLQNLNRQNGLLWELLFSIVRAITKGKTPSSTEIGRCISGMALGFGLAIALSAIKPRLGTLLGILLLITAFISSVLSRNKKEVEIA